MSRMHQEIILFRTRDTELTLDEIAEAAGLHPELVERFLSFGLIEPLRASAGRALFAPGTVARVRAIERLRRDIGVNLAGIGVIFELLERVEALERELDGLRRRDD